MMVGQQNTFASAMFRSNPLVSISHDSDLSQITDNTLLNSVVGPRGHHVNEKYRTPYPNQVSTRSCS